MIGHRVGRLLVVHRGSSNSAGNIQWICRCDCGAETEVRGQLLRSGVTRSCGCLRDEMSQSRTTHGHSRAGQWSPEYQAWRSMRKRCLNKNHRQFDLYGGRGIRVCARWSSFENFYADMGVRPSGYHSLDRYPDQNGNYEPTNCRWATDIQQNRNKRTNIMVEFRGKSVCLAEAAESVGLSYDSVRNRIVRLGWSPERALTEPIRGTA